MDSFFSKGAFKASKCKTMLKLTIPRIKLLRNRREIQIKQMRRDIAKLLETGQEATARIRVEHIIREEKMMAAQEILELFSELIAVRLPIIEAQKECPLDLKEAISSVCFAAPRCADLPELQQVQLLFLGKYGKEFVAAATELRPECGVNRQLIELLSIRAPSPDVKLKVLKEIAEEHQLDWDPSASETELLKPHEDLLNGPAQFVNSSKVPLPDEKHEVPSYLAPEPDSDEVSDSETGFDSLDFPEVPKQPIRPSTEMLPFPADALSDDQFESPKHSKMEEGVPKAVNHENAPSITVEKAEEKQFLPFILPPPQSAAPSDNGNRTPEKIETLLPESLVNSAQKPETKQFVSSNPSSSRAQREVNVDLQDVLAAAVAAAESAERAAAAARSAASLAQMRISELSQRRNEPVPEPSTENPFHVEKDTWELVDKPHVDRETSPTDSNDVLRPPSPHHKIDDDNHHVSDIPSYEDADATYKSFMSSSHNMHDDEGGAAPAHHVFDRLPSMDDDPYTYPSLFTHQGPRFDSPPGSFTDDHTSKNGQ